MELKLPILCSYKQGTMMAIKKHVKNIDLVTKKNVVMENLKNVNVQEYVSFEKSPRKQKTQTHEQTEMDFFLRLIVLLRVQCSNQW